jgi:hypothetical protein
MSVKFGVLTAVKMSVYWSSGLKCHVDLEVDTNVSEERTVLFLHMMLQL